jgi:DNA-binding transcriptional LysR family regulator
MLGNEGLHLAQLRAFAAVVEQGSFTRAAEQLYLSQPAISAHVRRLEATLGAPLLVRDGRKAVPTELGLTVYRYACEVRATLGNLQHDVDAVLSLHLNHCAIGAPRVYSTYVLTDLLARFQQSHTSTHLTLIEVSPTDLVERIRQGQVDVGIALTLHPLEEEQARLLGVERRIIVESAIHPITQSGVLTYEEYV